MPGAISRSAMPSRIRADTQWESYVRQLPAASASVALLGRDLTSSEQGRSVRIVDLGPTLGDAPPPRIAWRRARARRGGLHRARMTVRMTTRDTALYAIAGDVATASPVVIPQQRDDSLAFDLAFAGPAGLLAWDEATSASRGVVRAAVFSKDRAAAARDLSPPDSDAELPRVVAAGAGFVVIWIARKPEPPSGLDASGAGGHRRSAFVRLARDGRRSMRMGRRRVRSVAHPIERSRVRL